MPVVGQQGRRCHVRDGEQEAPPKPGTRAGFPFPKTLAQERFEGSCARRMRSPTISRPFRQVVRTVNTMAADDEREPPAVGDLEDVGAEERQVDDEERGTQAPRPPTRPTEPLARDDAEQHGRDDHGERHGDAVRGGEAARTTRTR